MPVQLDIVGVSLANQYRVWPWALTRTVPSLVLRVPITAPDVDVLLLEDELACGWVAGLCVLVAPGEELPPQAARTAAAATASTGAAQYRLLRMIKSPFLGLTPSSISHHVSPARIVHADGPVMRSHSHASDCGYRYSIAA